MAVVVQLHTDCEPLKCVRVCVCVSLLYVPSVPTANVLCSTMMARRLGVCASVYVSSVNATHVM